MPDPESVIAQSLFKQVLRTSGKKALHMLLLLFVLIGTRNMHAQDLESGLLRWYPLAGDAVDMGPEQAEGMVGADVDAALGYQICLGQALFFRPLPDAFIDVPPLRPSGSNFSITALLRVESETENQSEINTIFEQAGDGQFDLQLQMTRQDYGSAARRFVARLRTAAQAEVFELTARNTARRDAWLLLTMTYDGAFLRLYLDDEQIAETPCSGALNWSGTAARIGKSLGDALESNMWIDELRMFSRALTPEDMREVLATTPPRGTPGISGQIIVKAIQPEFDRVERFPWRLMRILPNNDYHLFDVDRQFVLTPELPLGMYQAEMVESDGWINTRDFEFGRPRFEIDQPCFGNPSVEIRAQPKLDLHQLELSIAAQPPHPDGDLHVNILYRNSGTRPFTGWVHVSLPDGLERSFHTDSLLDNHEGRLRAYVENYDPTERPGNMFAVIRLPQDLDPNADLCLRVWATEDEDGLLRTLDEDQVCVKRLESTDITPHTHIEYLGADNINSVYQELKFQLNFSVPKAPDGSEPATPRSIIVEQELPLELDPATFRMKVSSFGWQSIEILGGRRLRWQTSDVKWIDHLSDSLQGFLRYSIRLKGDVIPGSRFSVNAKVMIDGAEQGSSNNAELRVADVISSAHQAEKLITSEPELELWHDAGARHLHIQNHQQAAIELQVADIMGRTVLQWNNSAGNSRPQYNHAIDISQLPGGFYVVLVRGAARPIQSGPVQFNFCVRP